MVGISYFWTFLSQIWKKWFCWFPFFIFKKAKKEFDTENLWNEIFEKYAKRFLKDPILQIVKINKQVLKRICETIREKNMKRKIF